MVPQCRTTEWVFQHSDPPHECRECGTGLTGLPVQVRARIRIGQAVVYSIVAAFLLGPPLYIVYGVVNRWGDPLVGFRETTVTVTEVYGILPDLGAVLMVWLLILMIAYGIASGAFPRRV